MAALSMNYAKCRTLGHSWDDEDPAPSREPFTHRWTYQIILRCTRCGMERYDGLNSYGNLSARRYIYPQDYRMVKADTPSIEERRLIIVGVTRRKKRST